MQENIYKCWVSDKTYLLKTNTNYWYRVTHLCVLKPTFYSLKNLKVKAVVNIEQYGYKYNVPLYIKDSNFFSD